MGGTSSYSMVIAGASLPDVRFIGGMNGRVHRNYNKLLNKEGVSIDEEAVTAILLNQSA